MIGKVIAALAIFISAIAIGSVFGHGEEVGWHMTMLYFTLIFWQLAVNASRRRARSVGWIRWLETFYVTVCTLIAFLAIINNVLPYGT